MSEWITDRLPTAEDAIADRVIVWGYDRGPMLWMYRHVPIGEPWMPIRYAPYVKPKRWTLTKVKFSGDDYWYVLRDDLLIHSLAVGLSHDDALRIIDIYNEVMP
jgi:hypothetical protein